MRSGEIKNWTVRDNWKIMVEKGDTGRSREWESWKYERWVGRRDQSVRTIPHALRQWWPEIVYFLLLLRECCCNESLETVAFAFVLPSESFSVSLGPVTQYNVLCAKYGVTQLTLIVHVIWEITQSVPFIASPSTVTSSLGKPTSATSLRDSRRYQWR